MEVPAGGWGSRGPWTWPDRSTTRRRSSLEVDAPKKHRGLPPPTSSRPPSQETAALDAHELAEGGTRSTAGEAAGDRRAAVHVWGTSHSWRPMRTSLGSGGVDGWVGGGRGRALVLECYCVSWMREEDKKLATLFRTTRPFPPHHKQTAKDTALDTCWVETACSPIHVITGFRLTHTMPIKAKVTNVSVLGNMVNCLF
jgi:hypothetical protein